MKTLHNVAFVLFISASLSFTTKTSIIENTLTATYKGISEQYFYKFVDEKKVEHLFYDLDENVAFSLDDDANIGKKFTLTWKTKQIEEYDDEGDETGEKTTVKTILSIQEKK
ncbi:hypothetical protein [Polaribacter sp. Asnod1-A03]|uniref:hypothetical protein n=1 Tax=Polaribacter sp. Asnod1-A03 TaxID=3160581 RepID=UPI0038671757